MLRVLLVEDNPGDAMLVRERLADIRGAPFRCTAVETLEDAISACRDSSPDVVLLDLNLPDSHGLETLDEFRKCSRSVPLVVLTGMDDLDTAVESLRRGADDYLAKADVGSETLRRTLTYAVERRKLRFSLESAIRGRDELLRVVSHDLRNQMSTLSAAIHLLRLDSGSGERVTRRLDQMEGASNTMNRLLTDLLDMAAMEKGALGVRPAPYDGQELIAQAVQTFQPVAEKGGIHLRVPPRSEPLRVLADRERVLQVLGNLVGNALRHTPSGGTVSIACEPRGDKALFTVKDTGPGISKEDQRGLFGRFFRGSSPLGEGLGLGLAIAKGLVEAHAGEIGVSSEPGQGATFWFSLPAHSTAPELTDAA